jgi:acetylornithine deacetylase/succinyl-diaminopimelate desuccinylase-like protein
MNRLAVAVLLLGLCRAENPAANVAHAWRVAHEQVILSEFTDLLAIPNLASDMPNIRRNAAAIAQMMEKRGVHTRLLETESAPPVLYGEITTPNATRTVVFYAHYDGQPLDPKEWATDPWKPVTKDGRIYARSASDDKAAIVALMTALDALKAANISLKQNIRFVFEGEEEAGSPHLDRILAANKDLLKADVWLICDGPVHQSRRQQIVFGARGVVELDVTVYGPRHELHSGHYGNWAPNPAMMLARLLASMKDDDGRIQVEKYYDRSEPHLDNQKPAIPKAPSGDEENNR